MGKLSVGELSCNHRAGLSANRGANQQLQEWVGQSKIRVELAIKLINLQIIMDFALL